MEDRQHVSYSKFYKEFHRKGSYKLDENINLSG